MTQQYKIIKQQKWHINIILVENIEIQSNNSIC